MLFLPHAFVLFGQKGLYFNLHCNNILIKTDSPCIVDCVARSVMNIEERATSWLLFAEQSATERETERGRERKNGVRIALMRNDESYCGLALAFRD